MVLGPRENTEAKSTGSHGYAQSPGGNGECLNTEHLSKVSTALNELVNPDKKSFLLSRKSSITVDLYTAFGPCWVVSKSLECVVFISRGSPAPPLQAGFH